MLPNQVLNVGNGGKLDSYPYILVEFFNAGYQGNVNALSSNNPFAVSAVFRIYIDRYLYDIPSEFFYIEGPKNEQIISFRPDQDVQFTLLLPNGEIIEYSTPDNLSPDAPNPLLQVNALFSIRPIPEYQKHSS